jgi:hypothetical protein
MPEGAPAARERPKVLYVMGAGRSGSTVFGIALGNCPNVFYAGELDAWLARDGVPQIEDDPERQAFWAGVREETERGTDALPGLYGITAQRAIERSLAVLRPQLWRTRRRLLPAYRAVAGALYGAVARQSGAPFIVDTSHYPLRARALQPVDTVELYLLYLRRDPRSVAASFRRTDVAQYSKSTLTTNVYLWLTSLLSVLVYCRQPSNRRMTVRYEDFVARPDAVVRDVLELAGASPDRLPDFSSLAAGLPFQGNRVMRRATVSLDGGLARALPRWTVTRLLQAPLAAVHALLRPVAGMSGEPAAKR